MQKKIVEEVEITPEEVRNFFQINRGFAFGAEMEWLK
jgi:hypothetical protein